ncbi:elicitor peptide 7 precursor [Arabidopsis thaliana]|uniref:Elicitor peptide 7 n=2 Tax=Arabidopsis thaliana TaxID=3702 RepID=PEP7_ARATH|nr:elicitor peptide 7 precursor [Arabidopsis thaliana]P0C1T5.1 RecName: Full=Elicitor peptide 7; Flags: Precursor [Arabidopsis thaliana]ABF59253.1 unknown protein [Arabidopsis thaliana]AED91474.1 elicitor peptide 7 precursor [Arabidopsis thaliana]|eukprot:NP_001078561.1 elicitor peptide 7 precursor [Arabidopsis thaliana]
MEGEGRREDGDCSYLCIPFNSIRDIFQSFFTRFRGLTPDNSPVTISQEVEEETEVVNIPRSVVSGNVAARKGKQQTSSGKGGGTN